MEIRYRAVIWKLAWLLVTILISSCTTTAPRQPMEELQLQTTTDENLAFLVRPAAAAFSLGFLSEAFNEPADGDDKVLTLSFVRRHQGSQILRLDFYNPECNGLISYAIHKSLKAGTTSNTSTIKSQSPNTLKFTSLLSMANYIGSILTEKS